MSLCLEYKKVKRTGYIPAFLCGGILSAAVPLINMAVRSQIYLGQPGTPLQILLEANWQMMTMLNILLVVAGSCLLYHTESADHAMQKMRSLPIREISIFSGKFLLTALMCSAVLAIEMVSLTFCAAYWFEGGTSFWAELGKNFGYSFLLMLPCMMTSLLISSACKSMWISLGIGVICVFIATMLPADSFVLSLFPFAAPFQILGNREMTQIIAYACAVIFEMAVIGFAEFIFIKVRRFLE